MPTRRSRRGLFQNKSVCVINSLHFALPSAMPLSNNHVVSNKASIWFQLEGLVEQQCLHQMYLHVRAVFFLSATSNM